MKWIINLLGQQTISGNSAMHIGRFERDDRVSKTEVFENLNVAQGRLNHRLWSRRTILLQQVFFQRPTVNADANRHLLRLGCTYYFDDPFMLANVSRVKPQLVDPGFEREERELVVEVN